MIPKVIFKFDKEKDLYNIWETCNKDSPFKDFKKTVHPDILKICQGKKFEECKKSLEQNKKTLYTSGLIETFTKALQGGWDKFNDEYFKRLEKVMKKPICSNQFTAYLTTMMRCPYNIKEYTFMTSFFRSISESLKTPCHEIMHFQFYKYYWRKVEKEIGEEKTGHLKEALTVLLNSEFKDLYFFEEPGYDIHKELRNFISNQWKKNKDFDILVDESIKWIKKNGIK
jgi:hypothetical protein